MAAEDSYEFLAKIFHSLKRICIIQHIILMSRELFIFSIIFVEILPFMSKDLLAVMNKNHTTATKKTYIKSKQNPFLTETYFEEKKVTI